MAKKATTPKTELAIIDRPEVQDLITKSGIELTKAEAHVKAFSDQFKSLSELSRPLAGLNKENPSVEDAKIARENRLKLVKVRTGSEAIKDTRKEVIRAEGDLIQATFNMIKNACLVTESEYDEIEKFQEKKEAERKEALRVERLALLEPFEVAGLQYIPVAEMDEEQFNSLLVSSKESFEAVKAKREADELARVEAEKKAEEERQAQILKDAEERESQRLENERLKKLEDEREEIRAAFAIDAVNFLKTLGFVEDPNGMRNVEHSWFMGSGFYSGLDNADEFIAFKEETKRSFDVSADRIANEKLAKDQKAKLDRLEKEDKERKEAEELAHQKEKERIEAEEKEKAAKAKAAELAPDKERINSLFLSLKNLAMPECKSAEAKKIVSDVQDGIKIILEGIKTQSVTLK